MFTSRQLNFVVLLDICIFAFCASARPVEDSAAVVSAQHQKAFSVVDPVEGHTRLSVAQEGLDVLRRLPAPVVPVFVIGPYRSGKSFLLNQLLSVHCDVGFGVGHSRSTQTRGIWVWGEPIKVRQAGQELSLLLFDTEGFESTGKADAYDDRIFALSALLSSVLIYNLPETVRESDIQKLSFAVQLADSFYAGAEVRIKDRAVMTEADFPAQTCQLTSRLSGQLTGHELAEQGMQRAPLAPATMLWLIQRDFLEGKTVQAMVKEALEPVSNPDRDPDIDQVNQIRASLAVMARNSTAFGLRQPHLERTRLCELEDGQLDPGYIAQRSQLRELVFALAKPKVGAEIGGAQLADLIGKMVAALNSRDIPTAGSILEHFNRELVGRLRDSYAAALEAVALPVTEEKLDMAASLAHTAAMTRFEEQRFGSEAGVAALKEALEAGLAREMSARQSANALASVRICDMEEAACEALLEREQRVVLPSTTRFAQSFRACREAFSQRCIGPGAQKADLLLFMRLLLAWSAACRASRLVEAKKRCDHQAPSQMMAQKAGACTSELHALIIPCFCDLPFVVKAVCLTLGVCAWQGERLDRAWDREVVRFNHDYNDKLFNGLLGVTFLDIVIFRFVIRISLMETLGWLGFAFLQVLPAASCIPGSPHLEKARQALHMPLYILAFAPFASGMISYARAITDHKVNVLASSTS
ncbi:hypothetical protein MMC29_000002 [Sticta canariensis]|nr:hypothetical protein [Sticta canariensis]